MTNHEKHDHNKQQHNDNNQQSAGKIHGGETRNGRLSQIKNSTLGSEDELLTEYLEIEED
jgi:hypothetical protein